VKVHSLILDTPGFFARSISDLELLADVFGLFDDASADELKPTLKGLKFGIMRTMVWSAAGPGTVTAMDRATELLKLHGAEVEEVILPSVFDNLARWHGIIVEVDGATAFTPEYRTSRDRLAPFLASHVENRHKIPHWEELQAFDGVAALRPKMDDILGSYTAVITPSVPDEAPLGQEKTGSPVFNTMWTVSTTPPSRVSHMK
jgi:Asp-tRNA(Asn)/Glu-tRNA(Gln) amidotransferase A subunit family amidase